jgi:hypothetical protein
MANKHTPLIPNPKSIELLTRAGMTSSSIATVIIADLKTKASYATISTLMGGICLIAVVGAFVYLVMNGHDIPAGSLLAVQVVAIFRQLIASRL